ncbi:helix-turn-helix transcriptional regulator [Streptomyces sp. JJ66]|uniref:PadR family transcriptional regulator n=1 Tax=Streptomyces sp. JJ66 TaxID=2803843 RepID=UPI001C5A03FB|nr:PadR family transcriptional regulator [Streptomyces sp. JJ66]MBW1603050.1 helix-turn-helix transcriptional regulator [Streptomyces sp. JJ66]
MPPVFAHGRLRLYLLKLLAEAPRHGYEVIRLLEERFQGLYAPSAGTVYPRLAKLEAEGLVSHTTEGGRKVYSITERGRGELAGRQGELTDLEREIHDSLTALAAEIREDVHGSASDLRHEMREAAERTRSPESGPPGAEAADSWREVNREWKEQARRAKAESRKARRESQAAQEEARRARQEAQHAAQEEVRRIARQVQDQVSAHAQAGDWQGAVREGMAELAKEMSGLSERVSATTWPHSFFTSRPSPAGPEPTRAPHTEAGAHHERDAAAGAGPRPSGAAQPPAPEWATEPEPEEIDPARAMERLLDRFRDDIRDAARDNGVTHEQLREIRRHLSTAAAHIGVVLRPPR